MKTVFLFIPTYVYSSDLLRTEYIKYLTTKFRVVLFAPFGLLVKNKPYYQSPNLIYVDWKIESPKFWVAAGKFFRYCLIRKYDFEPVVQRNRDKGMKDLRKNTLRFLAYFLPKNLLTPDMFTWLEVKLAPESKLFSELVKKYDPQAVITATPGFNHIDAEAIVLAKQAKIPTVAVDFSWDNLHNGGIHFRRTDYLIVWNEIIKSTAMQEYGYLENKIFVSGTMRFDNYFIKQPGELTREEFLRRKVLDPQEKTILMTTVTKGNYPDEDLLLTELLKVREDGKFSGYPNIFVRLHPKEQVKKFTSFMEKKIKNLHVEEAGARREIGLGTMIELDENDLLNLKHTLMYVDVNVNYLSTITLESFVFDKPVVNINFPEKYHRGYTFRHYKPLIDLKSVRLAYSFKEMIDLINMYLANPETDREQRQKAFNKFIFFKDGLSYKRSVDFLEVIINGLENNG